MVVDAARKSDSKRLGKLRAACDSCHRTKVKCSGSHPCERCQKMGFHCIYSTSNRIGRPKHTRNKKTIERIRKLHNSQQNSAVSGSLRALGLAGQPTECLDPALSKDSKIDQLSFVDDHNTKLISTDHTAGNDWLLPLAELEAMPGFSQSDENFFNIKTGPDSAAHGSSAFSNIGSSLDSSCPSQPTSYCYDDEVTSSSSSQIGIDFQFPAETTFVDTSVLSPTSQSLSPSIDRLQHASMSLGPKTCKCLQHQANLLVSLKETSSSQIQVRIDLALLGISRASEAMRTFLRCDTCWSAEPHHTVAEESLVLAVMNIGLVVKILEAQLQCLVGLTADNYSGNDDEKVVETEYSIPARLGTYTAGQAETRMLSVASLFHAVSQVNSIFRQLRAQTERLLQLGGTSSLKTASQQESVEDPDKPSDSTCGERAGSKTDQSNGDSEDNNSAQQLQHAHRALVQLDQRMGSLQESSCRSAALLFKCNESQAVCPRYARVGNP
ncbi:C6 finger domain transcription factor gliZ [Talaromyces pinophilus]|nr:C6 finger domain transcription factor gliZ [Talaromyces pinophilus]